MSTLIGILVVAAAATLGDFIWYSLGVRHTMVAGVIHGAVLLTTVGGAIGAASGHLLRGLPLGTVAGVAGALAYYLLVLVMDSRTYGTAIPGAWIIMWLVLAALEGRWLQGPRRRSWTDVAVRGLAAALVGGLAFVLVRSVVWGRPADAERSYVTQFAAWAFAWAPGLVALTWGTARAAGELATPSVSRDREGSVGAATPKESEAAGSISGVALLTRIDSGEVLAILDVRTEGEFAAGHVPGAVNVPFNLVPSRAHEVPGAVDDELFVYCGHGPRAYMAASALRSAGRTRITYVSGHFSGWQGSGLRIER